MSKINIKLGYYWSMPNRWTFSIPEIKTYLETICKDKKVLFPFAGMTRIDSCKEALYIDINPDVKPNLVIDCVDWLQEQPAKPVWDGIALDPPFSIFASKRFYKGKHLSPMRIIKDLCVPLVKQSGFVITLGYTSTGMGKSRGFQKIDLQIYNHGGNRNDHLMLTEVKTAFE